MSIEFDWKSNSYVWPDLIRNRIGREDINLKKMIQIPLVLKDESGDQI